MSGSYTVVGDCDGCMCDECEFCLWEGAALSAYDPHFFCGDPIWGLELIEASGNKPCDSTSGNIVIPIGGTWYSLSNVPLIAVPLFPHGIDFQFHGSTVYSFDPSIGTITEFVSSSPAVVPTGKSSTGSDIYQSIWTANSHVAQTGIELATIDNPYHTGTDPFFWRQTDPVGTPVWDAFNSYSPYDYALLAGTVYRCILGNINQSPPNATYWVIADPFYLGVVPYTGPDPAPGDPFDFFWNLSGALVNVFFSHQYKLVGGMWVIDITQADLYQGADVPLRPRQDGLLRINQLVV